MQLRVPGRGRHFLAYEMNVHPGDSLAELRQALRRWTLPVRERLAPGRPFAIAPRVGRALLADLASARAQRELRAELDDLGLIPYSLNAFPLENFHARETSGSP